MPHLALPGLWPVSGPGHNSVESRVSGHQHNRHSCCYSRDTTVMYTRLILYLTWIFSWSQGLISTNLVAALLLLSYLITGGNYTLYLLYHTAWRDARGAWRYLQLLVLVYVYQKRQLTVSQVFQRTVKNHPDKVCMYFEDESWTFKQVIEQPLKIDVITDLSFSWMSTVISWLTSCSMLGSSTETPWPCSWRTGWSTSGSGWAAPRLEWFLP